MKKVTCYVCALCGVHHESEKACIHCEDMCQQLNFKPRKSSEWDVDEQQGWEYWICKNCNHVLSVNREFSFSSSKDEICSCCGSKVDWD